MIIDLNCPLEMRGYQIIYDDIGSSIATLDLFNLTDETVTGYSAVVHGENIIENTHFDTTCGVDDLEIEGGTEFKLRLSVDTPHADKLEIYFSKVVFSDGSAWQGGKDCELVDVGELHPLTGEKLDALIDIAGEDAVMYPEMQDNYWRCVCGRINRLEKDSCWRCRRGREYVLTELNAKILNLTKAEARERKQRLKRARRARERALNASSSLAYTYALISAVVIFLLLFVYIGFVYPAYTV